jgi:hypothetical protein
MAQQWNYMLEDDFKISYQITEGSNHLAIEEALRLIVYLVISWLYLIALVEVAVTGNHKRLSLLWLLWAQIKRVKIKPGINIEQNTGNTTWGSLKTFPSIARKGFQKRKPFLSFWARAAHVRRAFCRMASKGVTGSNAYSRGEISCACIKLV